MEKEIIKTAMQFMMRVDLKGQEVPAFNAAMNALQNELESEQKGESAYGADRVVKNIADAIGRNGHGFIED